MQWEKKTVTIVGLGLMGGSLALALRPSGAHLVGVEQDAGARALALRAGVVDEVTDDLAHGARDADLVVLAAPVRAILALIPALAEARPEGCFLLDLGSTKTNIVAALDSLPPSFRAVGGHPMCGKETSGLAAAEGDLFRAQTFVLCRSRHTDSRAAAQAEALVAAVGARPLWLEAAEHDEIVALVSHLPYLVASTLMAEAAALPHPHTWTVSASGFRDTSRLAGSSPRVMTDIVATNRPAILARLRRYRARLDELVALLESDDETALAHWLEARQREYHVYRKDIESRESE